MSYRDVLTWTLIKAMIIKGYLDIESMHKNTIDARKKNEKLLFDILRRNKNSEYGKKYGFEKITTVEEFRKAVPITTYRDYEEDIDRMIENNIDNVLTSDKVIGYAQTSGSVGKRKFIPITQPDVNIYTKYTVTRMLATADKYSRNKYGHGLKPGRGMFTGPGFDDFLPNGMVCSNVADVAVRQLGFLYPYLINLPFKRMFNTKEIDFYYLNSLLALEDRNTMFIFTVFFKVFSDYIYYFQKNWQQLADDIEHGTISDLARANPETKAKLEKVLKPNPQRAEEIRKAFSQGFDETLFKRLWPNMSVICGIGTTTFAPFAKICRKYTKDIPYDFSIYGASEGMMAACDEVESEKQLLLIDSCYYEFIPVDEPDKILSLNELEIGKEYTIIITNQAGLYRYKIGDVIKVVDYLNECPYIVFARRDGQLLNITSEKTSEEHMRAVVNEIEKASGIEIVDWIVYTDLETHPYRYVLMIENKEGKDMSQYKQFAHETLLKVNPRYALSVSIGALGPMIVGNMEYGANRAFQQKKIDAGAASTQIKPVRIIDNEEKEEFFMKKIIK